MGLILPPPLSVTLPYSLPPFVYCSHASMSLSASAFVSDARGPQTLVRCTSDGVGSQEERACERVFFLSPSLLLHFLPDQSEHGIKANFNSEMFTEKKCLHFRNWGGHSVALEPNRRRKRRAAHRHHLIPALFFSRTAPKLKQFPFSPFPVVPMRFFEKCTVVSKEHRHKKIVL